MKLNGIEFDDIIEEELTKFDYGIIKEKGKQSVKYIWLSHYETDFKKCESYLNRYLLECSSRGSILLEGKKIADKKENEEASKLFEMKLFH